MSESWREMLLGDVLTLKRGYDLPNSSRRDGDVPIVSSSGVTGFHDEIKVRAPGVVTGRYGTLGEVFLVKKDFWPLNTTLYVQDFKGNDPTFISYFLRTLDLAQQNAAGAVPGLNRNALHMMPVRLPPLPTQCKIATILSAYDDLIENNTRRITLLEEMARALYRQWFVEFRFPGHESAAFVEDEQGRRPEGWNLQAVSETFEIMGGGTPSKERPEFWEGDINWFIPSDVTKAGRVYLDESSSKITLLGLSKSSARLFPAPAVMMTSRATIGAIAVNTTPAAVNQGFIVCFPNETFPLHLLRQWLLSNVTRFEALASGATFKEISKSTFKGIQLVAPSKELASQFNSVAEAWGHLVLNLERRNANLRRTRDLLLLRLISGEVDVSDLSVRLPGEVASVGAYEAAAT